MAILTPLELGAARALGALYGLDVRAVRGVLAGSVNSNYALDLEGDAPRIFLRVYEEQTHEAAARESRLLAHLAGEGVPTPRPLTRIDGGAFLAEHAGKPVALFPWLDGESLCQARVTADACRKVGAALARVHLAGASFEGASPSRFDAAHLARRIDALRGRELSRELAGVVDRLGRALAELASPPCGPEAPLIHGDLFRDNVLWRGGEIAALLDFESASRGSRAFDLMVSVLAWCFGDRLEPELVRAMGSGYSAERPLAPEERDALWAEGRFAAVRFSITRITDFELRPRGMGVYKDYRRFLARLDALEALPPGELLTLVAG